MKDIAIIGVAGRFPDAKNIQELYENLKKGHCSAKRLSKERKRSTSLKVNQEYKIFSFLEDVDLFDHKFFKLSMAEAQSMDPHQRLLMEVVYETFESAGYNPDQFWGSNTAVFCGDVSLSYYNLATQYDPTLLTGNLNTVTASRISRFFNLRGTNLMVDTNCSSTLMATHLACNELFNGDADYSLVCGVRLVLSPNIEDNAKDEVGIMAFDGKTRSFDAQAEGTGAGEAAACVLLKPLDKAQADGDLIYGVIKATAVNQEAMLSGSLTAPSSKAQAEVIRKAWDKAGIDPATIGYVEPHGSGTKLGDPIEIQGLDMAYQGLTDKKHFVAVSAMKSNIGHTDTVAGLSGMVKVLLSLQNKQLFPTCNFDAPNPFIDFDNSVTYINTELKPWVNTDGTPLRAGLSSYGLSGTNCHVILEQAPEITTKNKFENTQLLALSAQSEAALLRNVGRLQQYLEQNPSIPLADISRTLNQGRKHFAYRTALLAENTADFTAQLTQITKKSIKNQGVASKKTLLIFPDNIEQGQELKTQLAALYPSFQASLEKCRSFTSNINSGSFSDFELQYALYHLLAEHGVTSKNVLGIGLGKIVIDAVLEKRPLEECVKEACALTWQEIPDFAKRFQALIDRETETEKVIFIELAPNSIFTKHLKAVQTPDSSDYFEWFSFQLHEKESLKLLLKNLYLSHVELNWELAQTKEANKTWLPPYSFEPIRCWLRELSPDEEEELSTPKIEATIQDSAPRIIPENFDSSHVEIDQSWTQTEKQIAKFWIEILKLDTIKLDDDFFKLGGHSLLATQLISRIEKQFAVRLEFKNIAQFSTIRSLAEGVDALLQSGEGKTQYSPLKKAESKPFYPVSKAQYRQWLLNQFDPFSLAYNLPRIMSMNYALDTQRVEKAVQQLIAKHESLRTSFGTENGEPVQYIHEQVDFKLDVIQAKAADKNQVIENFIQPFDLTQAPLFRVQLVQFGPEEFLFLSDIHHIVSDGVSSDIILNEFMQAYQGQDLQPLEFQYKDFSEWQNQLFESGEMKPQEDFWLAQFAEEFPVLELPCDFKRPNVKTNIGGRITYVLDKKRTAKIKKLTQESGTTTFMTLLALYNVLLHKYSGSEDLVVGSAVAGRSREELEPILGMFVNTLAIRNYPKKEQTFTSFLAELRENTMNIFANQDYPFEMLVDKLDLKRDLSRNPLFDTLFSYQNYYRQENQPNNSENSTDGTSPFGYESAVAKFDLTFEVMESGENLSFLWEYSRELFKPETVQRMTQHFAMLIDIVCDKPEITLKEISIVSSEERQLLETFNHTERDYDLGQTFIDMWRNNLFAFQEYKALRFEQQEYSYAQVDYLSDQLAAQLQHSGVKHKDIVAIQAAPSAEMFIGVLAILKAGAAFLPLDQSVPQERVQHIIIESGTKLYLHYGLEHNYSELSIPSLEISIETLRKEDVGYKPTKVVPTDVAYIIYTSGSTGTPKGIAISHRTLSNLLFWYQEKYQLQQSDCLSKFAGFGFDASIIELFPAALVGASLVIIPEEARKDIQALHKLLLEENVTVAFLPTAIAELYMDYENPVLKKLLIGGSKLSKYVDKSYEIYDNYGPTEDTVVTTSSETTIHSRSNRLSIGQPIANKQIYIVEPGTYNLCPLGVKGEILIAGAGLALGYWKNEALTKQFFVDNPFQPGTKLYHSGDLGRWLADGTIEFFGRIDQQVKISGNRIEPEEITHVLTQHLAIKEAAVTAIAVEGELSLVAYYVSSQATDKNELKSFLQGKLPPYMIPTYWQELEALPVTANGKIDFKKLPAPQAENENESKTAAANPTEETVLALFREVLRKENVGTDENFFEIGGHSLRATQLLSSIYKKTGVQIALKDFFLFPHVIGIAQHIDSQKPVESSRSLPKAEIKNHYPLSAAQSRLHFLHQLHPESIAYNIAGALQLSGSIDYIKLEESFQKLVERHPVLRTTYDEIDEQLMQIVHEKVNIKLEKREIAEADIITEVKASIKPFNLNRPPLLRITLLKISDENHILVFDIHHINCDGVSMGILVEEFTNLYNGLTLNPISYQYADYSEWLNSETGKQVLAKQKDYWLQQFEDEIPALNLPIDFPRSEDNQHHGAKVSLTLKPEILEKIKKVNQQFGGTNYIFLLAAYQLLISKHSGSTDITVGTPVAGRKHSDLDRVIGMFVNTLVIRNKPLSQLTFSDFLLEVKSSVIDALDNQEYPFEELVENLNIKREIGRNPLFDVFFTYQVQNETDSMALDEKLRIRAIDVDAEVAKFDLTLEAHEFADDILLNFIYNTALFTSESIKQLSQRFEGLINNLCDSVSTKIGDISVLNPLETTKLLHDFNETQSDFPETKTIIEIFEEQVRLFPNNTALVFEDHKYTYSELNALSNQFGSYLREKFNIQPDDLICIMQETSEWLIISIISILKSGAAYVPIDPEYPQDRIDFMLQDTQSKALIDANEIELFLKNKEEYCPANLVSISNASNLAYIIYTSGSTGNPKGVMIENRNLLNYTTWFDRQFKISDKESTLLLSNIAFDGVKTAIFGALLSGGQLHVITRDLLRSPIQLAEYIVRNEVSFIKITPPLLNIILSEKESFETFIQSDYLRLIIVGGEKINVNDIKKIKSASEKITIVNHYGPTETTVGCIANPITEISASIPIGSPISNTQIYILDQEQKLIPFGVIGEIYIAGKGVARGYLNRNELTKERFIENPFADGKLMYRSGDLARWLPDGKIEFLGRIDHQVKIRGYRIELGEIEFHLNNHVDIIQAAVLDQLDQTGEVYLTFYYVSVNPDLQINTIKQYLADLLPAYMVPAYGIRLDEFPLNANGKTDRKALLAHTPSEQAANEMVVPKTETEAQLLEIWKEILVQHEISVLDNFFEIGGHSLKAGLMVSKIKKKFGVAIMLLEIFKNNTIRSLSKVIDVTEQSIYTGIVPIEKRDFYPASSVQKRLFVITQISPSATQYNMSYAFEVFGSLDLNQMQNAIKQLVNRHESLRTYFEMRDVEIVQRISDDLVLDMEQIYCGANELDGLLSASIQAFELTNAPLVRIKLFQTDTQRTIVFFDMHHSLSDGLSTLLLASEFMAFYRGHTLPELNLHYRDYAVWQQEVFNQLESKKQAEFWLNQFKETPPILNLQLDFQRPVFQSYEGDSVSMEIPQHLVQAIKKASLHANTTSFMFLFASFNVLLSKYSLQDDIVVGTPVAGRPHPDLHALIGMFVNTLAIRNYPKAEKSFSAFLEELTHIALSCFDRQEYPLEELIDQVVKEKDLSRNPLFSVIFSYQNREFSESQPSEISFKPYGVNINTSKFDLQLDITDFDSQMYISFTYCTKLFKKPTIDRMMNHFVFLLEQVLENENTKLKDLKLISDQESQQILLDFNNTAQAFEDNSTLQELFERQVLQTPDATALVFQGTSLTYSELNAKANQLAYLLRDLGIEADDLVAIKINRSTEMVIGMLATLKAGGAYMPIDPEVPSERFNFLLQDSKAKVILTDREFDAGELNTKVLNLNDTSIFSGSTENMNLLTKNTNLAYAIYTSGSTGTPKGVLVEHRNVVNLIRGLKKEIYDLYPGQQKVSLFASYVFDASVQQIYCALLLGHELHIIADEIKKDAKLLLNYFKQEQITIADGTPTFLQFLVHESVVFPQNLSLRHFIIGGEALFSGTVSKLWNKFDTAEKPKVTNVYGPTECCVDSSCYHVKETDLHDYQILPIGKPLLNQQMYVLNETAQLMPVGVPGELYIGGQGVSRGYSNRPDLTQAVFSQNPFTQNGNMYRTGDLVRWLPSGDLEYLGRIDQQVKIRGFRIELGDIESQLLKMGFPEVAVIDRVDQNGDKYLCAYVVSPEELNITNFKATLAKDLPEYMIPSYFVRMDTMPLGSSGKLNRKALPEPDESSLEKAEYEAPETEIEKLLAGIWQRILGVTQVSANDHFFNLGGDSIKAIQVSALLLQNKLKLELSNLFQFPILRDVAKTIKKSVLNIPQEVVTGKVLLTPIQKHFFARNYLRPEHYNQAIMLESQQKIDSKIAQQVLNQLLAHHDALRIRFSNNNGEIEQFNADVAENGSEIIKIDLRASTQVQTDLEAAATRVQSSFQLFDSALFKLALIETESTDYLLFVAHHLLIDGVSWRILIEDFIRAYQSISQGKSFRFEEKTHSYQYWSEAIDQYAHGPLILRELEYWRSVEGQNIATLPKDGKGEKTLQTQQFQLNPAETDLLLKHVNSVYQTEINDILLSGLAQAIHSQFGTEETLVHLEGHGREDIIDQLEISRTVGWFTSIFPVAITAKAKTTEELIYANRDRIKAIPNKGVGYGILRYLTPDENKSGFAFKSKPEIIFNYLGQVGGGSAESSESPNTPAGLHLSGASTGISIAAENEGEYALTFNGIISGGSLNISVQYSEADFATASIQKMLETYQSTLSNIIAEAKQKTAPVAETASSDVMAGLEQLITTPILTLKDNQQAENIFFFPPAIGFSMVYQDLASQLSECNVYGVNFIEDEKRMDIYIQDLLRINGNKPFVFAGYSGGANLAYQVALELVKHGYTVSDIIMLDGMRTLEAKTLSPEDLQEKSYQYIGEEEGHPAQRMLKTKAERDRVRRIVSQYQQYLSETADLEPLSIQVHQIHSEQQWEEGKVRKEKWQEIIGGNLEHYQGAGEHGGMLNPENLTHNAAIFTSIVADLRNKKQALSEMEDKKEFDN